MKEEDVKVMMRRWMRQWSYLPSDGYLGETSIVYDSLTKARHYSGIIYDKVAKRFSQVASKVIEGKKPCLQNLGNLMPDDIFLLQEATKYSFGLMPICPFQDSKKRMPPESILMEYKGPQRSGTTGIYTSIGQTITYQVKSKLPTYLVIDIEDYGYFSDVFNMLPIGVIIYNGNLAGEILRYCHTIDKIEYVNFFKVVQHSDNGFWAMQTTMAFGNKISHPT